MMTALRLLFLSLVACVSASSSSYPTFPPLDSYLKNSTFLPAPTVFTLNCTLSDYFSTVVSKKGGEHSIAKFHTTHHKRFNPIPDTDFRVESEEEQVDENSVTHGNIHYRFKHKITNPLAPLSHAEVSKLQNYIRSSSEVITSTIVRTLNVPGSNSFHVLTMERAREIDGGKKVEVGVQYEFKWTGRWNPLKSMIKNDSNADTKKWIGNFYESLEGWCSKGDWFGDGKGSKTTVRDGL